ERRTMLSGFLNLETSEDGRYKANYLIHGTKSGRLSSRGRGKGPQLQNIPLMARRMFVASPGHALLQGDLKRAEAMFVAFDSESMKLRELYTNDAINPYCEFASDTMGFRVTKKDEVLYKTFKQVTHASNYGMAWKKLIAVLRLAGVNIEDIPIKGVHGGNERLSSLSRATTGLSLRYATSGIDAYGNLLGLPAPYTTHSAVGVCSLTVWTRTCIVRRSPKGHSLASYSSLTSGCVVSSRKAIRLWRKCTILS